MANTLNTINVDGATYDAAAYAATKAEEKKANDLDKNAFLKLLITQLENQDPLDPQDNSEFVAEMAQFSSLEQMTNMNDSLGKINTLVSNMDTSLLVGQLSGMIGKGVEWDEMIQTTDEKGEPVITTENLSGVITGVSVTDGATKVIVESEGKNYYVDISSITRVHELVEEEVEPETTLAESVTPLAENDPLLNEMITAEA